MKTDEQIEKRIASDFEKLTGLAPVEVSQCVELSDIAHVFTEDKTFFCRVTLIGAIKKGTLEEEV